MSTIKIKVETEATVPVGEYCTIEKHSSYMEGNVLTKKTIYLSERCEKLGKSLYCPIFSDGLGGSFGDETRILKCQACLDACEKASQLK